MNNGSYTITGRVLGVSWVRGDKVVVIGQNHNIGTGAPYCYVHRLKPNTLLNYSITNPEYGKGLWQFEVNRHDAIVSAVKVEQ